MPVMQKHTVTHKLVCRWYKWQAVTGHSWNGPVWRRIHKNLIEYYDFSMSLTTKRTVVTIRTTCLNIKELCLFTAEARVRNPSSTWRFVTGIGTDFPTSTSVFTCHTILPKLRTHSLFACRRGYINVGTTARSSELSHNVLEQRSSLRYDLSVSDLAV